MEFQLAGNHINGCHLNATIINESDGVGDSWKGELADQNKLDYGLISKTGPDQIRFNLGCGDDGFFQ
jgi:hypothetical protein